MSGAGRDGGRVDCHDLRVAVVAVRRHPEVVDALLAGARRALDDHHVEQPSVVRVPGSLQLPVVVGALAQRGYEAVVALGVELLDEEPQAAGLGRSVTDGLSRIAVDTGVAVGLGLVVTDTLEAAREAAGRSPSGEERGYEAASAALVTAWTLRRIRRGYEADDA